MSPSTAAPALSTPAARVTRRCPLCAGEIFDEFRTSLVRCTACGLVLNPAVWRQGADAALEEEYFGEEAAPATASPWVRWFERRNALRTLAQLRRAGVRGRRLLEVGVGSGTLLAVMREHGFDVEGCDLSAAIARRAREAHGITVHTTPLEGLAERYDVIVMNHVVEHVSDPVGFLDAARRRLRPGGVVHIAVPNVGAWEARLRGWTSYQPYHLVYFTPPTLARAAAAAGLRPLLQRTNEPFSGWFLALLRSLRASAASAPRPASADPGRPRATRPLEHGYRLAMVLAGALSYPLRALQQRVGRGEEVVLVAAEGERS